MTAGGIICWDLHCASRHREGRRDRHRPPAGDFSGGDGHGGSVAAWSDDASIGVRAALLHLAHGDFRILFGRDPENLADFLALGADGHGEFELQREAALDFPVVLPLHRAAVERAPLEVGDVGEQDDFREGLFVSLRLEGGGGVLENFVFVVSQHDVEVAAAAFDGADLDGLGDARLASPGEAERDVLEGEIGNVVGTGILTFRSKRVFPGREEKRLAEQLEKRLLEHFLVLGLHDVVAQRQRGAGGGENHADKDRQQPHGDHEFKQRESTAAGAGRAGDHGWYIRP